VFAIVLMILDKRVASIEQLRSALSMPLAPIQYMVSYPIQLIDKLSTIASTHDSLLKENLDLKAEQLLLKSQVQRLLAIESENNQLKALFSTSTTVQGKVLIAQIMAIDSDPFINQVTLNKGSQEGIFVGQPVLDASGVMGQIIQVGPLTSRVLLINDTHSGVPVQDARNGIRAIAVGDNYSGKLRLVNVPHTVDIKANDVLVTSGLGENYPEGYPLGKVASVIKDPGLQFATILVEPSARLDRSRQVLLVWPSKQSFVKLAAPVTVPMALPIKAASALPVTGAVTSKTVIAATGTIKKTAEPTVINKPVTASVTKPKAIQPIAETAVVTKTAATKPEEKKPLIKTSEDTSQAASITKALAAATSEVAESESATTTKSATAHTSAATPTTKSATVAVSESASETELPTETASIATPSTGAIEDAATPTAN
jgi:rod shape-determining protein MreC